MKKTKQRNKLKTKRAAAKRFKITGTGKVKFSRAGVRHLLTGDSRKGKRNLRGTGVANPSDQKGIHVLLPYGSGY